MIDGPLWFAAALLVCGAHALYLRSWRRDRVRQLERWQLYDDASQRRHAEFMRAFGSDDETLYWNLDGRRERGRA